MSQLRLMSQCVSGGGLVKCANKRSQPDMPNPTHSCAFNHDFAKVLTEKQFYSSARSMMTFWMPSTGKTAA
jgi:hypothetical protein